MPKTFQRNGQFWLLALQVATVNFFTGGFGPSQALLREDQGTSLGVAGLHGTAMGVAAIIAGGLNSKLVHRYGRSNTTWIGLTVLFLLYSAYYIFFFESPNFELIPRKIRHLIKFTMLITFYLIGLRQLNLEKILNFFILNG